MKNRLDFIACPFCSGHELVSVAAEDRIKELIDEYVGKGEDVYPELRNICNVIENSREPGRPEPARPEESWLDV